MIMPPAWPGQRGPTARRAANLKADGQGWIDVLNVLAWGWSVLYNLQGIFPKPRSSMGVDPTVAGQAGVLTAIGIGTAFLVLVMLLVVIILIGAFNSRLARAGASTGSNESDQLADGEDAEARDRALAAALAVTALLASRPNSSLTTGGRD